MRCTYTYNYLYEILNDGFFMSPRLEPPKMLRRLMASADRYFWQVQPWSNRVESVPASKVLRAQAGRNGTVKL